MVPDKGPLNGCVCVLVMLPVVIVSNSLLQLLQCNAWRFVDFFPLYQLSRVWLDSCLSSVAAIRALLFLFPMI